MFTGHYLTQCTRRKIRQAGPQQRACYQTTKMATATLNPGDPTREKILQDYRKKLLEHKELEARLKESKCNDLVSSRSYKHIISRTIHQRVSGVEMTSQN